jgi:hypothetical protein
VTRRAILAIAGLFLSTALAPAQIYVSPSGNDNNPGTEQQPFLTIQKARDLARTRNQQLAADLTIYLAAGTYRLSQPLALDAQDSGTNGHNIIYTRQDETRAARIIGSVAVTGWELADRARNLWSAPAPDALKNTRQLYVDGVRAYRTRGRVPVALTQTVAGYTAGSTEMARWRNPADLEFVYTGGNSVWSERSEGLGPWTEPRCPVAAISGAAITMAQPCWDNSTKRAMLPSGERTANLVGPAAVGKQPAYVENAYELLGTPGQWYFDRAARRLYYVPRPGEDLSKADVEAPVLETLLTGEGAHNLMFSGLWFEFATWLQPSSPEGFSEIQANYTLTGANAWATQGLCSLVPNGQCPYGAWTRPAANVRFHNGAAIQFEKDVFAHLGAAGLDLGDGAQNDRVEGCLFSDISGNGLELGAVDQPLATGAGITRDNQIRNNHIVNIGAEYHGAVGLVVGYAQRTIVAHNQLDHLPYAAISMGWGGWPDKIRRPGQANYSQENLVANNRIFDYMLVLADGGAIYTQGLTGPSLDAGEKVTTNVIYNQFGSGHAIYTDNGSSNVTVADNVIYHTNFDNWGSRHHNYYNAADGKDYDPLVISGNYWQQGTPDSGKDAVRIQGNHLISMLEQVPFSILGDAGIQEDWRHLLDLRLGRPSPPEPPLRVGAAAGNGVAYVTWTPSVFKDSEPMQSYIVTASSGAQATISAEDLWSIGYVKITGLPNGKPCTFTVTAKNANGASSPSMPSLPVTPSGQPISPPAAPSNVKAYAGAGGLVSIHFQDPAVAHKESSPAPIMAYIVTVKPGNRRVTLTGPAMVALQGTTHTTFGIVDGLKPGETYTFDVAAVNPAGEGAAASTDSVTLPKE